MATLKNTMAKKTIQKVFGHIVLYLVIILGIFALQFRNQSIISRNFGQLRLTLSEIKNEAGNKKFKDSFSIVYKGISLFSNTENPVFVTNKNKETPLVFQDWKEMSDSMFELHFSDNFILLCGLTGKNKDVFTVSVISDTEYQAFSIPFSFSDAYSVMELSQKRAILGGKTQQNELSAPLINTNLITLTSFENTITYSDYEPSKEFMFESITTHALAQKENFDTSVQNLKNALISQFSPNSDLLTEQIVVSYITEMASRNKYSEAVSSIPDSFVNGTRRTFVSAPYLNNLAAMNKSLMMQHDNLVYKLNYALEKNSLDIFRAESLHNFLLTQNSEIVKKLLALPGTVEIFEPVLAEAAGIITTYAGLLQKQSNLAAGLSPYVDTCVDVIRKACVFEDNKLILTEKEEKLTPVLSVHIAYALIEYGKLSAKQEIQAAGFMIFNSQIESIMQFDLRTIAELYAVIESKNTYYPHIEVIGTNNGKTLWAWTSAKSVSTTKDADGTVTIQTSFPAGYTHYMIIHNVEPFKSIEIYDMLFRTDARFESYNSSGYVYDADTNTLFLKYRHKTYTEKVRLFYKEQKPEVKPVTKTQEQEETVTKTTAQPIPEPVPENKPAGEDSKNTNSNVQEIPENESAPPSQNP